MSNRIKALVSWVLALTFICLIVTGFTLMYHAELFGLRGYPLKVVHINLAILSMVAGIGHLYFNFDTLCKYVWIRKKGPNMIGTFLVALVMTVAVIAFSATTPNRCGDPHGRGHQAGPGQGQGRGQGGEGYGRGKGDGQGRGQGGEGYGRGKGDGQGRGQGGEGYGRGKGDGQGRGQGGEGYGRGKRDGQGRGQGGEGRGLGRGQGRALESHESQAEPAKKTQKN